MSSTHRTAQISPDRLAVGVFAIALVTIVMAASMVFSYVGIAEAAKWTGVPGIHWIAPIFIDGAIITYTVSLTVFEWRQEERRTIAHTKRVLRGFTLLSVGLNFAHTASFWDWDFTVKEAWFGSLISVAAPIAALLSAEEVVRLAFRRRTLHATPACSPADAEEVPAVEHSDVAPPPSWSDEDPHEGAVRSPEPLAPPAPPLAGEPEQDPSTVSTEMDAMVAAQPAVVPDVAVPGNVDDGSGIVRYPVQGEVPVGGIDRATDIDMPF